MVRNTASYAPSCASSTDFVTITADFTALKNYSIQEYSLMTNLSDGLTKLSGQTPYKLYMNALTQLRNQKTYYTNVRSQLGSIVTNMD